MRYLLLPLILLLPSTLLLQKEAEPQRYTYKIEGTVFEETKPRPNTTVCLVPAVRPINGRLPCTRTSESGQYELTTRDIADKYNVCASTTESVFIFANEKDKEHRVVCSGVLNLPPRDHTASVNLKFGVR